MEFLSFHSCGKIRAIFPHLRYGLRQSGINSFEKGENGAKLSCRYLSMLLLVENLKNVWQHFAIQPKMPTSQNCYLFTKEKRKIYKYYFSRANHSYVYSSIYALKSSNTVEHIRHRVSFPAVTPKS